MDTMVWIIICMLACIGVAVMLGDYIFVRRCGGIIRGNYRIITLYDDPVEVERMLNKCLLRMNWNGPDSSVILVDMGMGKEALATCNRLRTELYGSFLCDGSELADTLRRLDRVMANRGPAEDEPA